MILLIAEIREGLAVPDFGQEYREYMEAKRHPGHRMESISAWNLLKAGLERLGFKNLPVVSLSENGKPMFKGEKLHFSLSHSGKLAAVVISDQKCAVDVEKIDRKPEEKLKQRCMHPQETAAGMDFFECWTKKECMGKLSGKGMPAKPCEIDLTAGDTAFLCEELSDSEGNKYFLSAIGGKKIEWIEI